MSEPVELDETQGMPTPPLPPKVAAAIAAVMKEVPKLTKGETNTHGNFNFTSIDDFLEAVRPICAEKGLIIVQDEESFEMRETRDRSDKPTTWLLIVYAFTLSHSSGETWTHRPRRSIMVNAAMGSQAFGAAQSYALKQFERSLFQIATGEATVDADSHPPGNLPSTGTGGKAADRPRPDDAKSEAPKQPPALSTSYEFTDEVGEVVVGLTAAQFAGRATDAFARVAKVGGDLKTLAENNTPMIHALQKDGHANLYAICREAYAKVMLSPAPEDKETEPKYGLRDVHGVARRGPKMASKKWIEEYLSSVALTSTDVELETFVDHNAEELKRIKESGVDIAPLIEQITQRREGLLNP